MTAVSPIVFPRAAQYKTSLSRMDSFAPVWESNRSPWTRESGGGVDSCGDSSQEVALGHNEFRAEASTIRPPNES